MKNLVSVIVNYHNGEKYLEKCLKSIIDQDYKNKEIILWDNASTDNSKKVIEKFNKYKIKYFKSLKKENLYKARNRAIEKTSGDLIAFLDCDDWWEKNYLSSRSKYFNDKKFDFYYSNTNFYYEKTKKKKLYKKYKLPDGKIFTNLVNDYFVIISGTIFKKNLFDKFGKFNEKYNIIGDYDFIMKISRFCNAHVVNSPLLNYRIHENNFLKLNTEMYYREYKDWYDKNNTFFRENKNLFENKLNYIEILYLLENKKKNISLLKRIIRQKNFEKIIKLLILFFLPKKIFKFLRK
jgi:glycosyltransferase involved in cell wall biosynthesis